MSKSSPDRSFDGTAFRSGPPEVRLVRTFDEPFRSVITAARTCYSSRGIVGDEQVSKRGMGLARELYRAGHHTTFQHAQFQFALDRISRQMVWSFLHSHPFYNSEQVSQRYVEVKEGSYAIPPLEGDALAEYEATVAAQSAAYRSLTVRLIPVVSEAYFRIFPGRAARPEKYASAVEKRAMEVARYVLPVATFTYLYHTVSALTLLRYRRLCDQHDAPAEQRAVVERMVEEVLRLDPEYSRVLEDALPLEETPEQELLAAHREGASRPGGGAFREEFDAGLEGRVSRLVGRKAENEALLAASAREVLGRTRAEMDDEEAIRAVLDPGRNRVLGESLNLTTHSKLSRCMVHPSYTFRKKLSHTADSQDQRHRMTPGSRPVLAAQLCTDEPDYVTPELVRHDPGVEREFRVAMDRSWEGIARLRRLGVAEEHALYLLPNAAAVRFTESADLLNLRHKHAMRLCYNAQEEIWRASLDEAEQIREAEPLIGRYLLPPCTIRKLAGTTPLCPEGPRYCGVPVWGLDISEYERTI